jgi:glycerol kinase
MVIWGFEIGDSEALLQAVRYLKFRSLCIKIILTGLQKSEITDCVGGAECGVKSCKMA